MCDREGGQKSRFLAIFWYNEIIKYHNHVTTRGPAPENPDSNSTGHGRSFFDRHGYGGRLSPRRFAKQMNRLRMRPSDREYVKQVMTKFDAPFSKGITEEEFSKGLNEMKANKRDRITDREIKRIKKKIKRPKIVSKDIAMLVMGIIALFLGAKYLIDSVIKLSEILNIGVGIISLAAVALGTSLPELLVSAKAALQRKSEVALGNIFGSNVFNLLVVIGVPGLIKTLEIDTATFTLGLPVLVVATFLFIISGISRRIHIWEGAMYLLVYVFFIGKLFGIF